MTNKEPEKFVSITDNGVADAKRYHMFLECSTLRGKTAADVEQVNDREVKLMGLRVCSVCEKRATGGPAIEALTEIFTTYTSWSAHEPVQSAWTLLTELKDRGFYIASRKQK